MNADIIAQAALSTDVARELLLEAEQAHGDFDAYVLRTGIKRPSGTEFVQWREDTRQTLLADAVVRLDRARSLLGVPVTGAT